jgi:hypothetical protein
MTALERARRGLNVARMEWALARCLGYKDAAYYWLQTVLALCHRCKALRRLKGGEDSDE